jgi:hypothetical protein
MWRSLSPLNLLHLVLFITCTQSLVRGLDASVSREHDLFNGMAWEARLAFYDIQDAAGNLYIPIDLERDLFEWGYQAQARVHSNSWGSDVIDNTYTDEAMRFDRYSHNHPDFLLVVAAGNDGANGFATVSTPATAKNVLAVGASQLPTAGLQEAKCGAPTAPIFPYMASDPTNCYLYGLPQHMYGSGNVAYFSAMGPTADSRIKPDTVAPGEFTVSVRSDMASTLNCGVPTISIVKSMSGTSMSAPVAAGHVALIRQYYVQGWYVKGVKPTIHSRTIHTYTHTLLPSHT